MASSESLKLKWTAFWAKTQPVLEKVGIVAGKTGYVIGKILFVLYCLRGIFFAMPIVYLAMRLRDYCAEHLPETVGLFLQSSGDFAVLMPRESVLSGCMLLTGACLLMMLLSRKTLYPWLISLFSLVLPLLLLLTNMFPA